MPWRECRKVDERLRFVARLLEGEKMAVLCREFDSALQSAGHRAVPTGPPERPVVRRLQGRVHARGPKVLLSADHY
jgi:hypothetical protein